MSSIDLHELQGDLDVTRNVGVGAALKVRGSATIGHDLTVEGWLDAKNIRGANKGLFADTIALNQACPRPAEGWFAGVAATAEELRQLGVVIQQGIAYFRMYIGSAGRWVPTDKLYQVFMYYRQETPQFQITDRGVFRKGESYYFMAVNTATNVCEVSDVWYMGCRYRCNCNLTEQTPGWGSTDWIMVEGNPVFTVDFAETETLYDPDNFAATLTIVARLYNQDITAAIQPADVAWTRYSEDAAGVERVYDDTIWTQAHGGSGLSITLTAADCGFNGYMPRTLRFTATVTLRDGAGEAAATESASFEL